MDVIGLHTPFTLIMMAIGLVGITIVCLVLRDNKPSQEELDAYYAQAGQAGEIGRINILQGSCSACPIVHFGCRQPMVPSHQDGRGTGHGLRCYLHIGSQLDKSTTILQKNSFKGMGSGYGSVMGIIIAAGVFAAGLESCRFGRCIRRRS